MKKRTSDKEIGALCTMLIEDFLGKFHYSNTRIIDIVSFVTRYLGAKITYEKFAEKNRGVCGFISDGKTQICETIYNLEYISARMLELPNHQGSRIYKKYILGFSNKEIAISEGVSKQTVSRSILLGKAKIHDLFVELGVIA
ncbi:MAG: hypothetical protein IKE94_16910 [Aeriscardovia sp.]|nr:hypothetical protein [Aeriscardovia sp.]